MKITEEQIVENWECLLNVIKHEFTGERKDKLLSILCFFFINKIIKPVKINADVVPNAAPYIPYFGIKK